MGYLLTASSPSAYKSSAADSLLAERGRIDSSHRMTDDMLEYVLCLYFARRCLSNSMHIGKRTKLGQSSLDKE